MTSTPIRFVAPAVLVLAAVLAWANSFSGPFVFDDRPAILANPTLESFSAALAPPRDGGTVAGRPLVNLSLALNRAVSGEAVWSYHVFNLLVHVLAGLALFGLVRRTLNFVGLPLAGTPSRLSRSLRDGMATSASPTDETPTHVAFSAALLWLVHPLQTAAVTYTVQRAESLMALFFLLTLYGFVRATEWEAAGEGGRSRRWLGLSEAACLAGMACKEVMAVAPVIVLLYHRTFVSGGLRATLRYRYYAALAATWVLLGGLVVANAGRAGTAGFTGKIAPVDYALTQCAALVRYLALAVWPQPLVFDYGTPVVTSLAAVWPQALFVVALVALVGVALWRAPRWGFLGACFLLILAPSSSFVPVATQTMAEHRLYLPLAALTTAFALGLHAALRTRAVLVALLLAVPLAVLVARRNADYRSALTLWTDTAAKRPGNSRARNEAGNALAQAGRRAEALAHYEAALRLAPDDAEVHNNLANALTESGRAPEALPHYAAAVRLKPAAAASRLNLANALLQAGRAAEAIAQFEAAAGFAPLGADAESGLGAALAAEGRLAEAIAHYENALRLRPDFAQAHYNLGLALARSRQMPGAIEHFGAAARLVPGDVAARVNLGNALLVGGRAAEAIVEYETALRLRPDDPQIRANLERARARR